MLQESTEVTGLKRVWLFKKTHTHKKIRHTVCPNIANIKSTIKKNSKGIERGGEGILSWLSSAPPLSAPVAWNILLPQRYKIYHPENKKGDGETVSRK